MRDPQPDAKKRDAFRPRITEGHLLRNNGAERTRLTPRLSSLPRLRARRGEFGDREWSDRRARRRSTVTSQARTFLNDPAPVLFVCYSQPDDAVGSLNIQPGATLTYRPRAHLERAAW